MLVARSFRARLLGLALLRELPPGCALLIPRCSSVHTLGMRFPLDVVFLDRHGLSLRLERAVPPWRVVSNRRAAAVLETAAGQAERFVGAVPESPLSPVRPPATPA